VSSFFTPGVLLLENYVGRPAPTTASWRLLDE
jgi:hypothetical protein